MHPKRTIDRYLTEGLSTRREAALRRHLAGCEPCRDYHDQTARLIRILHGGADRPTEQENERLIELVKRAALTKGLLGAAGKPDDKPEDAGETLEPDAPSLATRIFDRILLYPLPSTATATAFVLLLAASALLATTFFLGLEGAPSEPVAHVVAARNTMVDGEVLAEEEARGRPIRDGEALSTATRGLLKLTLESGGSMRLFPGTEARLMDGGRTVVLDIGRVWCQVEASDDPFVVRTPSGEARVLGTSFVVEHTPDGRTDVRVITGRVEVTDVEERGRVEVPAGRRSQVVKGEPPSRPRPYDSDADQVEWESLWSRILDALQRALEGARDVFRR